MRPRVGFLFNHDQLHQVAHALPIARALAGRDAGLDLVLITTSPRITAEVRRLVGSALGRAASLRELALRSPASRAAAATLGRLAPLRKLLVLRDNLDAFRTLDLLVTPEKTALALKTRFGLAHLAMVHTRHGAGDRAIGFDRASAGFDLVLASGRKVADRLAIEAGVDPARIAVVGYPKFDAFDPAPAPRLFDNDRPTVLYNPHPSPALSSWFRMGRRVLDVFAASQRYNLIFAPHVMLFERPLTLSLDPPGLALPGRLDARYARLDHMRMDLGSAASTDMTYTRAADIYLGDASSQVYEFLLRPRPCVFLDAHRSGGADDADRLHWRAGPVVGDAAQLEAALDVAQAQHAQRYAPIQRELVARTFDLADRPSSERAADAILALLDARGRPALRHV